MISIDVSDWKRHDALLEQRAQRCQSLPPMVTQKVFDTVKEFLETKVFIGKISYEQQKRIFEETGAGIYGHGGGADPFIINPQERLGGVDIPGKSGPHFLASLSYETQQTSVSVTTKSRMKPYPPDAKSGKSGKSGLQPVMVYFREGWSTPDGQFMMKPRIGSPGHEIAKMMREQGYVERMAMPILHWIVRGTA